MPVSERKETDKVIATADFETDPFMRNEVPVPFCWGFYSHAGFFHDWKGTGDACIDTLFAHLDSLEESHLIYFHNGGKFDFFYFLGRLDKTIRIVNGRILQAFYTVPSGITHEFRDSYAAIPVPLREYRKDEIDYRKLFRSVRDKHRPEIVSYLKTDCVALHELVTGFHAEFGDILTVGSAAMKQFGNFHEVAKTGSGFDAKFRPFYFGGRNQCFKAGIIRAPLKIYDINSQYPFSMATFRHPTSAEHEVGTVIGPRTFFATIEATSFGALPARMEKGGLNFNTRHGVPAVRKLAVRKEDENGKVKWETEEVTQFQGRRVFNATIHEINAGLETGTLKIHKVLRVYDFKQSMTFDDFVNHFYKARKKAKAEKDTLHALFYKLILNSAYGKFAQDPANYFDWTITPQDELADEPWELAFEAMEWKIWKKPALVMNYYNVATAASITGAARSVLLRGIQRATMPVYCDTDSLICTALDAKIDNDELGAWKDEGGGDVACIAGKKLYAIFDTQRAPDDKETQDLKWARIGENDCPVCFGTGITRRRHTPKFSTNVCEHCNGSGRDGAAVPCVKFACKGSKLTPGQIYRAALGETVQWESDVPTFTLAGLEKTRFIGRSIRQTAEVAL